MTDTGMLHVFGDVQISGFSTTLKKTSVGRVSSLFATTKLQQIIKCTLAIYVTKLLVMKANLFHTGGSMNTLLATKMI